MSQISRNLTNSYENEVIREKIEEINEMRELQDQYESDAEYGQYADEEDVKEFGRK